MALIALVGTLVLSGLITFYAMLHEGNSSKEEFIPPPTLENITYEVPTFVRGGVSPTFTARPPATPGTPPVPDTAIPPIRTPEPLSVDCAGGETILVNAVLRVGLCLPAGWAGTVDGSSPAAPEELREGLSINVVSREWFPYPTEDELKSLSPEQKERLDNAISIAMYYAPPDLGFEGCTPELSKVVPTIPLFCEDIYNVPKSGQVEFAAEGERTTWKLLAPVKSREIGGFHREGGSIFIRISFATAIGARVVDEVLPVLERLSIPPE